jgi:hypothetical protein
MRGKNTVSRPALKASFVLKHQNLRPSDIIDKGLTQGVMLSKSYVAKVLSDVHRKAAEKSAKPAACESAETAAEKAAA